MKKYLLVVTFGHFGTKDTIKNSFGGGNIISHEISNTDFEGTEDEFHSGSYEEVIELDENKDLLEQVIHYIKEKDKEEYFSLKDFDTKEEILSDMDNH